MGESGGDVDLAQEAIRPQARGQVGAEHLEGDQPAVFQVLRQVDGRHAPMAELAFDAIALGKCDLEAAEQTAHTVQDTAGVGGRRAYGIGARLGHESLTCGSESRASSTTRTGSRARPRSQRTSHTYPFPFVLTA